MGGPISVVFMGTPEFAAPTLLALIGDQRFDVQGVITQPDRPKGRGRKLVAPPVKQLALDNGLPVWQPEKAREPDNVARLEEIRPDYLVVAAYGQILPPSILEAPSVAPVNLHASLLPRWRGAAPIHRALLEGDAVTGVCAMLMAEGLDTGDVLRSRQTVITDQDTFGSLHDRLARIGAELITETLPDYKQGAITPEKQNDDLATYAKKLGKTEYKIDWSADAGTVSRHIRALSPVPGAMTTLNGVLIKPLFAVAPEGKTDRAPGDVISLSERGIEIACGGGSVIVTELKPEGKGPMSAHAYTLGRKVGVGDRFE